MAAVITNVNTAFGKNSRRLAAYDSTGRLWVLVKDGAASEWQMWYSDDGSSFTEATSLAISSTATYGALDIDTTSDRAVVALGSSVSSSTFNVVDGITSSSTWSSLDLSTFPSVTGPTVYNGELVTFQKPGSSNFFVGVVGCTLVSGTTYYPRVWVLEYDSSFTKVANRVIGAGVPAAGADIYGSNGSVDGWATIDFRHTGDGSTVASSTPDVFVACVDDPTDTVYFRKYSWTGTTWTQGAARNMGTCRAYAAGVSPLLSGAFDGSRYCLGWVNNADGNEVDFVERDAADTTTTSRSSAVPSLSGGAIQALGVAYDGSGDAVIHASGATADDVHRTQFVRATGLWDSWSTLTTTTVVVSNDAHLGSSRAWAPGKGIAVYWMVTNAGNDVTVEVDFVNTAPSAPTWVSPGQNLAQDRGAALTLDWAFVDVDQGDTQSAYKIKRRINGGSAEWWTGSAWGAETKITSTTTSLAMSSGWATDGDTVVYNVLCYDAADVVGPYSDDLTVIASVPDNPTMTAPATSATLTVAQPTVSWTVAEQSAYQVDVYETDDSLLYSTGKITSTSTSITLGYTLDNGLTDLKFKITTWNADDLVCSTPDTNTLIDVTYTVPATPVLTVTAVPASGYISVAIADPTPGGGQPTVDYHDVYVRVASGGRQDGERTVNDSGIRISTGTVPEDGTYLDYAAASGVSYEYRVQAFGDNGAVVFSAWA